LKIAPDNFIFLKEKMERVHPMIECLLARKDANQARAECNHEKRCKDARQDGK
jgi:hypothetical protein